MMSRQKSMRWLVIVSLVLLLVATWAMTAIAQEQEYGTRPSLHGHGFVESVDVPSPFVGSFIYNRLGVGIGADLKISPLEIGGEPIEGLEGNLIFAILDFEYQYAIKPWIAARARILANGRLGSDTLSLLSQGITMSTGFEFGWLIRLHERERTALSLDLNLADRAFTAVNISRFVEDIIDGRPASLVQKTPSARGGAGLRFAWAASPLLGVSANAHTGFGESVDRTKDDVWFWRFSGALDFDIRTKSKVPLGMALGFAHDTFPEFGGGLAEGITATFLRLSYMGRQDFLLSLDLSYDVIPVSGDRPDMKVTSLTIGLRYYI